MDGGKKRADEKRWILGLHSLAHGLNPNNRILRRALVRLIVIAPSLLTALTPYRMHSPIHTSYHDTAQLWPTTVTVLPSPSHPPDPPHNPCPRTARNPSATPPPWTSLPSVPVSKSLCTSIQRATPQPTHLRLNTRAPPAQP